ncbi:MAG: hypothetical protein E5Y74_08000 [Mesorhizobium sp.]|nr:MAG: hypothetical protein E5Y74_08000 [Mesorhizobium sp.]
MGITKRYLDEIESQYNFSRSFLVKHGTLRECEYHPGIYYDGNGDLESAYKILNAKVTSGEIELEGGKTRRDMTDSLKSVYEDNSGPESCYSCDKHRDE